MVDCFIESGVIVSTQGRSKRKYHEWKATGSARYANIPMIVLINHGSASASEIVAGALQDHDRALIIGQTSFGKGLVMHPYALKYENNNKDLGSLILSMAHYLTPSGRLIQRPYDDSSKEDYLKEGFDDYDPNALEIEKEGMRVYKTDLGRDVYGGGGITPDIKIPSQKLNTLEWNLKKSNLFFEFNRFLSHSQ